jgi:hypothetical protein
MLSALSNRLGLVSEKLGHPYRLRCHSLSIHEKNLYGGHMGKYGGHMEKYGVHIGKYGRHMGKNAEPIYYLRRMGI